MMDSARTAMKIAARDMRAVLGELAEQQTSVVGEIFRTETSFVEWRHYPPGDVYDPISGSQYYYHAHNLMPGEHGHFHTFVRPYHQTASLAGRSADTLSHLIGIRMNELSEPTHLFTTNRWVTGETYIPAYEVRAALSAFGISPHLAIPHVNRWLTALIALYRAEIATLLDERDRVIEQRRRKAANADLDIFEDRTLEITSSCEISLAARLNEVSAEG